LGEYENYLYTFHPLKTASLRYQWFDSIIEDIYNVEKLRDRVRYSSGYIALAYLYRFIVHNEGIRKKSNKSREKLIIPSLSKIILTKKNCEKMADLIYKLAITGVLHADLYKDMDDKTVKAQKALNKSTLINEITNVCINKRIFWWVQIS